MWILILWGKGQLEDLGYIYLMLKIAHILMPIEYFFEFLNNWLQIDFLSLFPFYFLNFTCFGTLLVRKQASIRLWAPQGRGGFLSTSSGHTEHLVLRGLHMPWAAVSSWCMLCWDPAGLIWVSMPCWFLRLEPSVLNPFLSLSLPSQWRQCWPWGPGGPTPRPGRSCCRSPCQCGRRVRLERFAGLA